MKLQIEKIAWEKGYKITDEGEVISPNNSKLKKQIKNKQYYKFNIRHQGVHKRVCFHRLQAYRKFGDKIYEEGIVVRHLNGNSFDNSYANIEIGTQLDNILDIPPDKRKENAIPGIKKILKYSNEFVLQVREFYNKCKSYKKTQEHFNIKNKSSLHCILHRNLY